MGRLGWVRSIAWHWVFSSKLNTTARAGGFIYRPTTSTSFSSKCGSLDSLKLFVHPPGLEVVVGPDPGDRVLTDPETFGQRAGRPMGGGVIGGLVAGDAHDLVHRPFGQGGFATASLSD